MTHSQKKICELTYRETEILQLLGNGWSNKAIADHLSITIRTVKFHTANIYSKIGVDSRSGAIAWAWRNLEIQELLWNKINCT